MQACNAHGVYCVPLYDTLGADAVEFIICHAKVTIAFVEEKKIPEVGYRAGVTERYGEDPANHPPLDTQLWHEVTGRTKKGRSFGFGYHADPNAILGGSSSSGGASSSSQQHIVENLMTEVQELKQREETRREEDERRREEDERRRQEEARFRAQYEEMCALVKSLSQNTPHPPPLP